MKTKKLIINMYAKEINDHHKLHYRMWLNSKAITVNVAPKFGKETYTLINSSIDISLHKQNRFHVNFTSYFKT